MMALILAQPAAGQSPAGQSPIGQLPAGQSSIAQSSGAGAAADQRVADMLARERAQFLPPPPPRPKACPDVDATDGGHANDEIVVCRRRTRTERYRVPSTAEASPRSAAATNTGVPRVPGRLVSNLPDCTDPEAHCIGMGWAPPPLYDIDVASLPEAPEGSDAARIAAGEAR